MTASVIKLKALLQTYSIFDFTEITKNEVEQLKITVEEIVQTLLWDLECKIKDDPASHVVNLQRQLTYLADGATSFDRNHPNHFEANEFIQFLVGRIYHLLNHLLNYYPAVFDFEAHLPSHFDDYLGWPGKESLANLDELLREKQVDKDLTMLLLQFFTATSKTYRFRIHTWRQWRYREDCYESIYRVLEQNEGTNSTLETLKFLIAYEFNSIQIYGFFIRYIEKITIGTKPMPEQHQELLYLTKLFRQVRCEVRSSFDPDTPSLKQSVLESLEAELSYITEKEKAFLNGMKEAYTDGRSKFYFKVAVTLAELMFFFRVALEVGMMSTKFNSYLYEFINNHIQTERADNISKKSMRNHFNNKPFSDRIVKTIRDWLEKMIQHIDLYYK